MKFGTEVVHKHTQRICELTLINVEMMLSIKVKSDELKTDKICSPI
jgi:hypothetical protein